MWYETSSVERRMAIDDRLETALPSASDSPLELARETVLQADDRCYGQLLIGSYDSCPGPPATEPILAAATAVELLCGYCRLRELLISRTSDATSLDRYPIAELLAADYLYASAYSTLAELDNDRLDECFGTLTTILETMIETFSATYTRSPPSAPDHASYIDGTAGALTRGAAVMGATLAGSDSIRRDRFATFGRGFGTARRVRFVLVSEVDPAYPFADTSDDHLRRHAIQRLEEANEALRQLSAVTDVAPLRTLLESTTQDRSPESPLD